MTTRGPRPLEPFGSGAVRAASAAWLAPLSVQTARTYRRAHRRFVTWLTEQGITDADAIPADALERWRDHLVTGGMTPGVLSYHLSGASSWLTALRRHRCGPTADVVRPHVAVPQVSTTLRPDPADVATLDAYVWRRRASPWIGLAVRVAIVHGVHWREAMTWTADSVIVDSAGVVMLPVPGRRGGPVGIIRCSPELGERVLQCADPAVTPPGKPMVRGPRNGYMDAAHWRDHLASLCRRAGVARITPMQLHIHHVAQAVDQSALDRTFMRGAS